jgi:hypothetical protein
MKRSGRIDVILIVLILYLLGLTQGCSGVNEAVKSTVPGGPLLVEPPNAVYAPRNFSRLAQANCLCSRIQARNLLLVPFKVASVRSQVPDTSATLMFARLPSTLIVPAPS